MQNKMRYTIGVKRPFGLGWKTYPNVTRHEIETLGSAAHLVLTFADGTVQTIPDIAHKAMKVYPDHVAEQSRIESYQREIESVSNAIAEKKVSQFVERQQQSLAARQHMAAVNGGMPQVPIQR